MLMLSEIFCIDLRNLCSQFYDIYISYGYVITFSSFYVLFMIELNIIDEFDKIMILLNYRGLDIIF